MANKLLAATILLVFLATAFSAAALPAGGLQKTMNVDNAASFLVGSKTTSVRLDRIYIDNDGTYTAVLTLRSRFYETGLVSRFKVGDAKEFDVNLDGQNDLRVTLQSTSGSGRASFLFEELAVARLQAEETPQVESKDVMVKEEPVMEKKEEVMVKDEPSAPEAITGSAVQEQSRRSNTIGWTIVGVIVLLGLVVYFTTKKKPQQ